jgi:cytochrome c biogenesis protein CcmG, thiol:disulfide interchange protein DsbE
MQSVKTDRFLKAGIGVLAVAFVYTIYAGIHERVIAPGDRAPEFQITADNGQTVGLPHFKGKLLVLNFWASWCQPCVDETPSLSQFARRFAAKNVVVLGVSVDKDEKAYRSFLQRYRPAFLTARDSKLHADFGTFMYPETYLIDAKGTVLEKYAVALDWSDPRIAKLVDSLL